jgi:thiol:disulfide interchange protein
MPQPKASRQQPAPARKSLWLGLAAVVLAVCAVAYCLATRPASAPPAATSATPAAPAPFMAKHLYSETADPNADITAALARAKSEHKRVLLDFGGDWCGDCQVLDIYFHQPPNDQLLRDNFVLVHVWVGHIDTHLDVAERYGVLIHKGVPELAVLSPDGRVLYAQKGEFEDMRHMEFSSVTEFLEKWKG